MTRDDLRLTVQATWATTVAIKDEQQEAVEVTISDASAQAIGALVRMLLGFPLQP